MLLPDGKATVSRVEGVIFDAMYTVIEPKITRFFYVKQIFEELLGIKISPKDLAYYLRESQKSVDPALDYQREWALRNRFIAAGLLKRPIEEVDVSLGEDIHHRILSHPPGRSYADFYEIRPGMRNLLLLLMNLREPPRLILASNQYRCNIDGMVEALNLKQFFGRRIATSDDLICAKPNPLFFSAVLSRFGLQRSTAVIVGNSIVRDLPPARALEIPICIYNRDRKIDLPLEPNVAVVRTIAEMQDWLLSRLIPGWVQKEEEPIESLIS